MACAAACHPADPCTARRAFASGPGSLAPSRRARDRCRRQPPARGLARFGRRPRGLPRSPPRRRRTTACRTFFVMSELQPMPLTCADTAPDSWSLPASVQGGSDSRITRSARTLVKNWTLSSWPEDRQLARPFGPAGRLEPRAGRASHYPDGGLRRRQLPIRGYGHILNLDSPRGCHEIAPAHTANRLPMTSVPKALPSTTAASHGLSHRRAAMATASAGDRGPGLPRRRVPRIRAGRGG